MTCYYKQDFPTEQMLWFRFMVFNATFNNTFFSFIVAVSFIGRGNQSTPRKPTCRKSLTNFIGWCCIEYTSSWAGFTLETLIVQVVVNPATMRSQPRQHLEPMNFSLILLPNELKLTYVTRFDVSLSILQISAKNMPKKPRINM